MATVGRLKGLLLEIAEKHGVHPSELTGPSRVRYITRARQEFMWTAYQTGRFSEPQIGLFLGGLDPSTVHHGRYAHAARLTK